MKPALAQVCSLSSPFAQDVEDYSAGECTAIELWLTKLEAFVDARGIQEVRCLFDRHGAAAPVASYQGRAVGNPRPAPSRSLGAVRPAVGPVSPVGNRGWWWSRATSRRCLVNTTSSACRRRSDLSPKKRTSGTCASPSNFKQPRPSAIICKRPHRWWPKSAALVWECAWTCFTFIRGPASWPTWAF